VGGEASGTIGVLALSVLRAKRKKRAFFSLAQAFYAWDEGITAAIFSRGRESFSVNASSIW
jgi:hypothetical protein